MEIIQDVVPPPQQPVVPARRYAAVFEDGDYAARVVCTVTPGLRMTSITRVAPATHAALTTYEGFTAIGLPRPLLTPAFVSWLDVFETEVTRMEDEARVPVSIVDAEPDSRD